MNFKYRRPADVNTGLSTEHKQHHSNKVRSTITIMLSSVRSTVFYVTLENSRLLLKPGYFIPTVLVITAVSCGTFHVVLWTISA